MFLLYMLDWDESIDTRLRELQHILELETHIIYVGGISSMHKPVSTEWSDFNSHWRPIFYPEVSQWDAHLLYNQSISCPAEQLKLTNSNSSTRKIRLTNVINSQAVAHKSWVARCSPNTTGFNGENLHNFHYFNHSHSKSSHHKDLLFTARLSSF